MVLDKIQKENDVRKLTPQELSQLPREIRRFLVEKISRTGGHLASNLGVVELTIALHLSLHFPEDKLIWDVGHQSYTHKLLTGRKDGFDDLRKYGGMSGFPKRRESTCDAFDTGHSSTSISAGLGYVRARELRQENYQVVSVIGDGSLTGGMAYEALNNAAQLKSNFTIILNDNEMSISRNVGGMSRYLNGLRTASVYTDFKKGLEEGLRRMPGFGERLLEQMKNAKSAIKQLVVPGMFFEDMGITYLGPVNGHDIPQLLKVLREARRIRHGVLIHVVTRKGKGYKPAEENPAKFHGIGPFDIRTGRKLSQGGETYTEAFGRALCQAAEEDDRIVAVTAAMADGTGLTGFARSYPQRFFDVGIAEEHAVTFAAGLAAGGMKPVVAIYSSFLQRAFDQAIHDVCLQELPVVFCVDRAGLVGSDGETHQGLFDIAYLTLIPNLTVMTPKNQWEMNAMLRFALKLERPVAIRYPRGEAYTGLKDYCQEVVYGRSEWIFRETGIALLFAGHMAPLAEEVRRLLKEAGYSCSLINARFLKPMDREMLAEVAREHRLLVTLEEGVLTGGYGQQVLAAATELSLPLSVLPLGLPDAYIEHGSVEVLRREAGLEPSALAEKILARWKAL